MKTFIKSLLFTGLGMALIIGVQSQNISFQDVLAQITGQFVKPVTLANQRPNRSSTGAELNTQIDYALPIDVDIFNIMGSMYTSNSIYYNKNVGRIATIPLLQDINGDGLADMIYSFNDKLGTDTTEQYVMLNNGRGYDLVYSCYRNVNTYTGDCAK